MTRKKKDIPKEKIQAPPSEPLELPPSMAKADPMDMSALTPTADTSGRKQVDFLIVGIGASAGGLKAFEAFFSGMPTDNDPGMAFVLVQHLAPDYKSILGELIRRYTRMQVFEVKDGMVVQPNCVYIIPPNRDMALLNASLQLMEPFEPRRQRLPIDFFFQSLAQDQRERAIGIILSGTGSDGTLGVRAIKGEGGMVMAQNPASTEFDGMPRNAIATGLVDYELPPAEMPAQLIAYAARVLSLPSFRAASPPRPKSENVLKKIFILLRTQTGHDFSLYKPSTILRRIERRMAVQQIDTMDGYVKYLQQTPAEVESLFRDMLIGVTNFFRDPEAFDALEERVIPQLFAGKPAGAAIRIWLTGCSTGEEAYSFAILLTEHQEALKQSFQIQIFATDIDSRAIAAARVGLYPDGIARYISKERLERFFSIEPGHISYRIHKGIRDMLVFSEHDVIKDPPFSRLDLISCRNLLIYMGGELQKRLMPLFHYALNPGGFLFLGTSETVGEFTDLFDTLDRKSKLYQRKNDLHGAYPEGHKQRAVRGRLLPAVTAAITGIDEAIPRAIEKTAGLKIPAPREQTERALLQVAPAGALVNSRGDVLYLHGRTGLYLEPAQGEPGGSNILKMAREGLRFDLTTALHKAVETKEIVHCPGLLVKTNGGRTAVNLTVHPVTTGPTTSSETLRYLVLLEEAPASVIATARQADGQTGADGSDTTTGTDVDARIAALQQELRAKEEYLQTSHEELESSTEELKSANEEMQSVNEELQSTNEELETSKEELQSVNEELLTVNTELQSKVADLSRANNDMNNLLAGTGIGTVFVDHGLHILRFTPPATQIMNMILSDLGRPVSHIASNLRGYERLSADVKTVLDTLIPKEVEVQTTEGKWYLMRILPYRTTNNVIEGAVITFVEITQIKQMYVDITELERVQAELRESEQRYRSVVSALSEAIVLHARNGTILAWNQAAERIFGLSGEQMKERTTLDPRWQTIHEDGTPFTSETRPSQVVFRTGEPQSNVIMGIYKPDGALAWISINAVPIFDTGDPSPAAVVVSFTDITEHRRLEEALRKANDQTRLAVVVRDAQDAITVQDLEGRIIAWNPYAARMYGWSETEALAMNIRDRIPEGLREEALAKLQQLSRAEILEPYRNKRIAKDGSVVEVSITASSLVNEAGQMYAIATTERNIESTMGQTKETHNENRG
jgi:two-component system CheB/CheR fusion protein